LDKVVAVAYWFQQLQGNEDWDSATVNNELKHLGYSSSNITRDLDNLMAKSPRYVIQTRKEGTTKQARKRYKLTREGIRAVEAMLNRTAPLADR
jgi:DNA-binding MarR family transcriptional regulator